MRAILPDGLILLAVLPNKEWKKMKLGEDLFSPRFIDELVDESAKAEHAPEPTEQDRESQGVAEEIVHLLKPGHSQKDKKVYVETIAKLIATALHEREEQTWKRAIETLSSIAIPAVASEAYDGFRDGIQWSIRTLKDATQPKNESYG
jgi:hypothetical protein